VQLLIRRGVAVGTLIHVHNMRACVLVSDCFIAQSMRIIVVCCKAVVGMRWKLPMVW